jgi:hypothetical protein
MAGHTATLTKVRDEVWGNQKVKFYRIDITSAGADGYALTAATLGFRRIREVMILGAQENGGYVMKYIPDTLGDDAGDGVLNVYQSDDAVDPLDEVTSGDLGEFRFAVFGY